MNTSIQQGTHAVGLQALSLSGLQEAIEQKHTLVLSETALQRIRRGRQYLENCMQASTAPIYGINTGFGFMYKQQIPHEQLASLQEKIVMSHACGIGQEVPQEIVRIMLLLKVQSLAYGHSGVREEVIQRLVDFYNAGVLPVVYQLGSLGASGDLAPLAHLSLPLLGHGEVYFEGQKMPAAQALKALGWSPLALQAKEGLALLNGTQFMAAYGVWCLMKGHKLLKMANMIGAMSLEAFDGRIEPFDESIHLVRPHQGQIQVAAEMRHWLAGSPLIAQPKKHVQDPYSFRCIPQVHGASADVLAFATQTFTTEINSVTDNPNIFPEEGKIISGGNFHGQPLAYALDFMARALSELGNISERRVYQLMYGSRELPDSLVANSGLNSGLMILQYTAASIVSQNKQLCTPASADSITSSSGQEDHVSMGANAATKCWQVVENLERLLAIELQTASQALLFRRPLGTSPQLEKVLEDYRQHVPFVAEDRILHHDMVKSVAFLQHLSI
jgi:histidine ammonia-lyase